MNLEVQFWIMVVITGVLVVLNVVMGVKWHLSSKNLRRSLDRSKRISTGIRQKLKEIESILDED